MKRRLLNIRARQVTEIMHLSYNPTTSLNLRIQTASGDDWEIDWGDGVWELYTSSTTYRTKTFGSSTSGVAKVRSATGKALSDLHLVYSEVGTWSFDVADLCATYRTNFYGHSMALTGDVGDIKATDTAFFRGNLMALTGDVGNIKATYQAYFNGNLMTLIGDVGGIKATYQINFIGSSMALTGDVGDIKATYIAYFQGNLMTLTGDVEDIKATYTAYFQGNLMAPTGDIGNIKATNTAYFIGNLMTLSGDVGGIKATNTIWFQGNSMTLTGNVGDVKATSYTRFQGNSMALTYTTTTWTHIPTSTLYLNLATGHLSTADLSQMLVDMDASGITGTATLDFRYQNGAPNASGVTAANNLITKGYNVLTN